MRALGDDDDEVDTSSWLTSSQVSDLCGISLQTIINYTRKELLKPRQAERVCPNGAVRRVNVFDPHQVARLPKRRMAMVPGDPGETAARAFELFEDGVQLRTVVTTLRIPPAQADELYDQWKRFGGADLIIGKAARGELEKHVGSFASVADLVERIAQVLQGSAGRSSGAVAVAAGD